jgi:hypothetical protein
LRLNHEYMAPTGGAPPAAWQGPKDRKIKPAANPLISGCTVFRQAEPALASVSDNRNIRSGWQFTSTPDSSTRALARSVSRLRARAGIVQRTMSTSTPAMDASASTASDVDAYRHACQRFQRRAQAGDAGARGGRDGVENRALLRAVEVARIAGVVQAEAIHDARAPVPLGHAFERGPARVFAVHDPASRLPDSRSWRWPARVDPRRSCA